MTDTDSSRSSVPRPATLLIASGAIGLAVAVTAMTWWPDLAHTHSAGYAVSGVLMTLSDALLLVGLLALRHDPVLGRGRLPEIAVAVAAAGSAGVVVAEILLRVDHSAGNALFAVVGPLQALGLILLGTAVLRAHEARGWRRWPMLATGLYVPLVLGPALAASNGENLPALAGLHTLIVLTGLSLRPPAGRPTTAPAARVTA